VRSAIADVQKAGCRAAWVKIEPADLEQAGPEQQAALAKK
jgi:hypothetical protein